MLHQRAILVPGHRLPETVRAVRFIPRPNPDRLADSPRGQAGTAPASVVEIRLGDIYGDLTGEMLTCRTVSDRTDFVFAENERPIVPPERSLVVVIRDPPARWNVEFDSEFKDDRGKTVARHLTIDNFGTARESVDANAPAGRY